MFHKKISVEELYNLTKIKTNLMILDVRSEEEFQHTHIPGSCNIPLSILTGEALIDFLNAQGLKTEDPIYVTCASGPRAISACQLLENDFPTLYHVVGCLNAWMEKGLPTESSKEEKV